MNANINPRRTTPNDSDEIFRVAARFTKPGVSHAWCVSGAGEDGEVMYLMIGGCLDFDELDCLADKIIAAVLDEVCGAVPISEMHGMFSWDDYDQPCTAYGFHFVS